MEDLQTRLEKLRADLQTMIAEGQTNGENEDALASMRSADTNLEEAVSILNGDEDEGDEAA